MLPWIIRLPLSCHLDILLPQTVTIIRTLVRALSLLYKTQVMTLNPLSTSYNFYLWLKLGKCSSVYSWFFFYVSDVFEHLPHLKDFCMKLDPNYDYTSCVSFFQIISHSMGKLCFVRITFIIENQKFESHLDLIDYLYIVFVLRF